MAKKILLSIPEPIFNRLNKEKEKYSYFSIQQIILEIVRDKFRLQETKSGTPKRGRPKKIDEVKIMTRKKIFSKHGEPISI